MNVSLLEKMALRPRNVVFIGMLALMLVGTKSAASNTQIDSMTKQRLLEISKSRSAVYDDIDKFFRQLQIFDYVLDKVEKNLIIYVDDFFPEHAEDMLAWHDIFQTLLVGKFVVVQEVEVKLRQGVVAQNILFEKHPEWISETKLLVVLQVEAIASEIENEITFLEEERHEDLANALDKEMELIHDLILFLKEARDVCGTKWGGESCPYQSVVPALTDDTKGLFVLDTTTLQKMRALLNESDSSIGPGVPTSVPSDIAQSILLILDTSGSMQDLAEGTNQTKLSAAVDAVRSVIRSEDVRTSPHEWALMVYDGCGRTPVVQHFSTNLSLIENALGTLEAKDKTPLAYSLTQGAEYVWNNGRGTEGRIILISDGGETCQGDPVEAARQISIKSQKVSTQWSSRLWDRLVPKAQAQGLIPMTIDVVGFSIQTSMEMEQLKAIARLNKGTCVHVSQAAQLIDAITVIISGQGTGILLIVAFGLIVFFFGGTSALLIFYLMRR